MATRETHLNHLSLFYDELINFINKLRIDGFSIGINQYLNIQELLVKLVAEKIVPIDPIELQSFIGPILCISPEEQEHFDRRYEHWVKQFTNQQPSESEYPLFNKDTLSHDDYQSTVAVVNKRNRHWKKSLILSGAIIALLMTHFHYDPISGTLLLLFINFRWFWLKNKTRLFLTRHRTSEMKVKTLFLSIDKPPDLTFQTLSFIHTAQEFRRHRMVVSQNLDIPGTIEKSIHYGGCFFPVMEIRKVTPERISLQVYTYKFFFNPTTKLRYAN